jgi:hypothetical protein
MSVYYIVMMYIVCYVVMMYHLRQGHLQPITAQSISRSQGLDLYSR